MPRPRYDGDQGGREPKLTPDPVTLGKIEMAASLMCPKSEIAHRLDVGRSTFFRFLAECEQARDAIDRGHDKFRFNLRVAQAQLAKKSPAMAIFLGKNYLDQTDKIETQLTGKDGGPVGVASRPALDYGRLSIEERRTLEQYYLKAMAPALPAPDGEPDRGAEHVDDSAGA